MTIEFRYREEESEIKHPRDVGGGEVPVIITKVDIRMDDVELPIDIAWALEEDVPPLLERTDLFDRFRIVFDQGEGVIIFEDKGAKNG